MIYKEKILGDLSEVACISTMPHLSTKLGKAGSDRIRFATTRMPRKTARAIENTVLSNIQQVSVRNPGVVDILTGIAHSCDKRPLNISRLFVLLQCLDYIDTKRVQLITQLSERQARKYVMACRLAIPHLNKYFKRFSTTNN